MPYERDNTDGRHQPTYHNHQPDGMVYDGGDEPRLLPVKARENIIGCESCGTLFCAEVEPHSYHDELGVVCDDCHWVIPDAADDSIHDANEADGMPYQTIEPDGMSGRSRDIRNCPAGHPARAAVDNHLRKKR